MSEGHKNRNHDHNHDLEAGCHSEGDIKVHSSCCPEPEEPKVVTSCCPSTQKSEAKGLKALLAFDKILWPSLLIVAVLYAISFIGIELPWLKEASHHTHELVHKMWWGVVIGAFFVGLLSGFPQAKLGGFLNSSSGFRGVLKATFAGVFFDLCSHGILMVGLRLYKAGASLGQLMAFLIASPWNSFGLTIVLFGLIGIKWTLAIIVLSMAIALVSGVVFEWAVEKGFLPKNPSQLEKGEPISLKDLLKSFKWPGLIEVLVSGFKESRMVVRWLLFGIVVAVIVQLVLTDDQFQNYFGPTLLGLLATVGLSTVIEVCSEGSAPLASQFLTKASAPGNTFAFLMTGVSTDYTEIMAIKDTTKNWKIALALPIITVPQVMAIAWLLNSLS